VNFSNNINKDFHLSDKYTELKKVKVFVGKGNNNHLIKSLLKRRFWLEITDKITDDVVFIWTQSSQKNIHEQQ
jgi:hypothetical protein